MYKLNIGVGYSILQFYYLPHNNKSFLIDVIEQHRIILSKKIIQYYIEKTDDLYKDVLETYIDSIVYTDDTHIFYEEQSEKISAIEEMILLVEQNPMKVVLGEHEEFSAYNIRKIKLITSQQIINKELNAIYRYSFPITNHYIGCNKNCEAYAVWFGHLFEGESQIEIQDKYILTFNGIECLKKYYLPHIAKGTEINIYCEIVDSCTETGILSELSDVFYTDWNIHVFICSGMHDRCIQLSTVQISIGAGLDFLHISGYTRKACILSITKNKIKFPLPTVIKQLQ